MKILAILGAATMLLLAGSTGARAADDFFKGKTIKLVCGCGTGAGYDNHARILSRHLPRHIAGAPVIVVQNLPAAGGLQVTNHIFTIAAKDGTEIGLFNRNTLLSGLLGIEQANFKIDEFNWLGTTASFSDNAHLFVVRNAIPHKTIDDLRSTALPPVTVGNAGTPLIHVLKEALGLNLKIVEGYTNNDLDPAFERGEIDGHAISWLSMMARAPHWIEKGYARPMVQFGRADRLPVLSNVPTARELSRGTEGLSLMLFAEAPLEMGYPFALPPGVPADRVALLRKAFRDTTEDEAYKADIAKLKLELTPKYGEEVQTIIAALTKSPPSVVKRYKELMGPAN